MYLDGRNMVQICTFLQTPNSTDCLLGPYNCYIMHILHILHVSHTLLMKSLNLWTSSRRVTHCGMSAETVFDLLKFFCCFVFPVSIFSSNIYNKAEYNRGLFLDSPQWLILPFLSFHCTSLFTFPSLTIFFPNALIRFCLWTHLLAVCLSVFPPLSA